MEPQQPAVNQPAPGVTQPVVASQVFDSEAQTRGGDPLQAPDRKKWLIMGGVALVVILAAGVAVLGYQNFKAGQQTPTPTPPPAGGSELPPAPPPVPGEIPTDASREPNGSAETADWETYTNDKYNFTIKYPKRISAYDETWQYEEFNLMISHNTDNNMTVGFGTPTSKQGGYIWGVTVYTDSVVEQLIKGQGAQFDDRKETRKNIIVNGKPAILVIVTTNQYKDWVYKNIYIEDKGKIYVIGNGAVEHPEFDLFYNTFKFLE